MARTAGCLVLVALIALGAYLFGRDWVRRHPQDVPWTALDLRHPVGRFTAAKIAALGEQTAQCRALLAAVGVAHAPAPARRSPPECSFDDGVRIGRTAIRYGPPGLVTSCPVVAALHLMETRVVAPAAMRHFGRPVSEIRHAGSFSCRRLYGRPDGPFSEHATADAIDITGFRLAGGAEISVPGDWNADGPEAAFLREVRDGACGLFTTVLSPDYNAAHRDHLHLDVADRASGWSMCR